MKTGTADTTTGVLKAIFWLRELGRPILAAKMERELLYADGVGQNRTQNQDSALSTSDRVDGRAQRWHFSYHSAC